MSKSDSHTVWSSDHGDLRKRAGHRTTVESLPPNRQTAYLHRDRKGRGGKGVILVKNLTLSEEDMKNLVKKLKTACGTGGTVKDGQIEIQGDQREKITALLQEMGYKVKFAGG